MVTTNQTSQISSEDGNSGNKQYHNVTSDYSVTGVGLDSASVGAVLEKKQSDIADQKKKKSDKDVVESYADSFNKATSEARQEFMYNINGYQFSNEALDETINEIIEDVDAWADKHGISKEEAKSDMEFAVLLQNTPPEERDQLIKDRMETHPESTSRVLADADENETHLENKAGLVENNTETSELDDMLEDSNTPENVTVDKGDGSFEAITKAPSTGTTDIFNSFADVGEVTQTPVVDVPKIPVKENIFDTFG